MGKNDKKNEATMDDILNAAKINMVLGEWKNIKEKAVQFCALEEEQQNEKYKLYFDIDALEKAASDAFDVLIEYVDQEAVPKAIIKLYKIFVEISSMEYLKSWSDGHLQFWTSIAAGLGNLVTERFDYDKDDRGFVFYMDDRQQVVEPGFYLYDLSTFNYHYIGLQMPW